LSRNAPGLSILLPGKGTPYSSDEELPQLTHSVYRMVDAVLRERLKTIDAGM
jgi:hypothetical protein